MKNYFYSDLKFTNYIITVRLSTLGNGMPTMLSNESSNQMLFTNCQIYCDSLVEDGFDDWIMPTIDQLTYASSGGCVITGGRSDYWMWSRTPDNSSNSNDMQILRLSLVGSNTGYRQLNDFSTANTPGQLTSPLYPKCRCVR